MDEREVHRAIRRKFRVKSENDCSPFLAKGNGRIGLAEFLGEHGFNRGAEIGVKRGEFSRTLCENNPNIELYSIDPWIHPTNQTRGHRYFRIAQKILSPFKVTLIKKTSMEALKDFQDEFLDFVYIDGNHRFDFVAPDIIFWSQKVREGGIVACHDYYNHFWGGVVKAVDAYTHCHSISPWYVTYELMPTAFWVKNSKGLNPKEGKPLG